jgi:hypothetical protein
LHEGDRGRMENKGNDENGPGESGEGRDVEGTNGVSSGERYWSGRTEPDKDEDEEGEEGGPL